MKRPKKIILFSLLLVPLHWQCVQKYNSPYTSPATGYLVVEGYISGNSPTQYTLSRTIPLPGDSTIPMETGAKVQVEGSDNSVEPLAELGAGRYGADTLSLNTATQYRLRITTADGEVYLSGYVPYKTTPPIDSISWVYSSGGVQIYANTHDPANATRYYQWTYGETWKYTSAEFSSYEYDADTMPPMVVVRPMSNWIYTCYRSDSSTNILINSTAKLAQDVVYEQPLVSIPSGSQQFGVEYSIYVRQYALTAAGYNFLSLMQQNTESLGSIFDATPSQLAGNIQCLTNPNETVVGYVSAGTVQQQRIFILRSQLPGWNYSFACMFPDTLVIPAKIMQFFGSGGFGFIPILPDISPFGGFEGWYANDQGCIDCRFQGGTTQVPSFWPN